MSLWTFQRLLAPEHVFIDAAADHGTIIALYFNYTTNGDVWRSTDGGVTWTLVATIFSGGSMGQVLYAGLIGGNKTWFILGHYAGHSSISTDDGQTWSSATDALSGGGVGAGASDASGTVIGAQNNGPNVECSVNASGLAAFATPAAWAVALRQSMLWDGTHFVAIEADSGPSNWGVWTAPSGFTIGAGPSWTLAATGTTNKWTQVSQPGLLAYVPSIGYAAAIQTSGPPSFIPQIVIASSPAGLVSATPQQMTMDSDSPGEAFAGAGIYLFWGNQAGNTYRSSDGTHWFLDTLSQAFQSGEEPGYYVYDSVHSTYILFGSESTSTGSSIYTSVGNVTVPNVVGDTQSAATTAITGAGLVLGAISSGYSSLAAGLVAAQVPAAGTLVPVGSSVGITISLGPAEVVVPNVVGLDAATAEGVIAAAGLTVGAISGVTGATEPIGSVATQSPLSGTLVLPGSFIDLGISFIVPEFDIDATVISQYANSARILALVEDFGQYFDPGTNLQNFYLTVWNIDTAIGFGLDIWGIILGVSRVVPLPGSSGAFGFENSDVPPDWQNFGNPSDLSAGGPFFGGQISGSSYKLNDGPYRTLLLTKALANICETTAPGLNALITNLFPGRGRCYTLDTGAMTMSYVFEFPLTTIEHSILAFSGVLAHPAGVGVNIVVLASGYFAFHEAGLGAQPFDFGAFYGV
jgi:Protein of unknown function (DUF2612)/PASTA domain